MHSTVDGAGELGVGRVRGGERGRVFSCVFAGFFALDESLKPVGGSW